MRRLSFIAWGLCATFMAVAAAAQPGVDDEERPAAALDPVAEGNGSAPGAPVDMTALAARLRRSVVHLKVTKGRGDGTGTGFVIGSDGRIATNHHVIDGASAVTVRLASGIELPVAGVLASSEAHDLAILKLDTVSLDPLTFGSTRDVKQGAPVVVYGNPKGLEGTLSTGIVSAIRGDGLGEGATSESWRQRLLQITAPISPGSSGSPVTDTDGRVLGVAMGIRTDGQNLNFVIPVERLQELEQRVGPAQPLETIGGFPWMNLGLSAFFFLLLAGVAWTFLRPQRAPASKKTKADLPN